MKKALSVLLAILVIGTFALFAMGSGESKTNDQGKSGVDESSAAAQGSGTLGKYNVEIKSCRTATTYDGKAAVIITYGFTNNDEQAQAFWLAVSDEVYQNDVGLNRAYVLDEAANYDDEANTKEVRRGATVDVEVAYELNDTTSDIIVEVSQFISFDSSKVTKTFTLS